MINAKLLQLDVQISERRMKEQAAFEGYLKSGIEWKLRESSRHFLKRKQLEVKRAQLWARLEKGGAA